MKIRNVRPVVIVCLGTAACLALAGQGARLLSGPRIRVGEQATFWHPDAVLSVAFSPDGKTLATGAFEGTVRLWDVASGKETLAFRAHTDSAASVAFSPDGRS